MLSRDTLSSWSRLESPRQEFALYNDYHQQRNIPNQVEHRETQPSPINRPAKAVHPPLSESSSSKLRMIVPEPVTFKESARTILFTPNFATAKHAQGFQEPAKNVHQLYAEERSRNNELEEERHCLQMELARLQMDKKATQQGYEEYIRRLEQEVQFLKSFEEKYDKADEQQRNTQLQLSRKTAELQILAESGKLSNSDVLVNEMKEKLRKLNAEKLQLLDNMIFSRNEINELNHKVYITPQSLPTDSKKVAEARATGLNGEAKLDKAIQGPNINNQAIQVQRPSSEPVEFFSPAQLHKAPKVQSVPDSNVMENIRQVLDQPRPNFSDKKRKAHAEPAEPSHSIFDVNSPDFRRMQSNDSFGSGADRKLIINTDPEFFDQEINMYTGPSNLTSARKNGGVRNQPPFEEIVQDKSNAFAKPVKANANYEHILEFETAPKRQNQVRASLQPVPVNGSPYEENVSFGNQPRRRTERPLESQPHFDPVDRQTQRPAEPPQSFKRPTEQSQNFANPSMIPDVPLRFSQRHSQKESVYSVQSTPQIQTQNVQPVGRASERTSQKASLVHSQHIVTSPPPQIISRQTPSQTRLSVSPQQVIRDGVSYPSVIHQSLHHPAFCPGCKNPYRTINTCVCYLPRANEDAKERILSISTTRYDDLPYKTPTPTKVIRISQPPQVPSSPLTQQPRERSPSPRVLSRTRIEPLKSIPTIRTTIPSTSAIPYKLGNSTRSYLQQQPEFQTSVPTTTTAYPRYNPNSYQLPESTNRIPVERVPQNQKIESRAPVSSANFRPLDLSGGMNTAPFYRYEKTTSLETSMEHDYNPRTLPAFPNDQTPGRVGVVPPKIQQGWI